MTLLKVLMGLKRDEGGKAFVLDEDKRAADRAKQLQMTMHLKQGTLAKCQMCLLKS
jgi:hypothetical protein